LVRNFTLRRTIGIVFLLPQLALVIQARFVSARWLCWAPNDYVVEYQLRVNVRGRDLDPSEIEKRYRLSSQGWYENPAENIMDIVGRYEQTEGRGDAAEVLLLYRLDGGEAKQWQWPQEWTGPPNHR
jgi:hypothetical protein